MPPRKGTTVSREQLIQWYHKEKKTTREIAGLLGMDQSNVIYWMNKLGVPRRSKAEALTKTRRENFSGNLVEKAYFLGFRLGDLHVSKTKPGNSQTIRVVCASSKKSQIDLIQSLFDPYGYVKITLKADGKTMISCYVNMSFEFLLPKQDLIDDWIVSEPSCCLAFLAGYIDAEGSFRIDANGSGSLKIESCDKNILRQLYEILSGLNIGCPPPTVIKKKENSKQKINQDVWRLGVYRKAALDRLCALLRPHLRHEQRILDMGAVWRNVQERNA